MNNSTSGEKSWVGGAVLISVGAFLLLMQLFTPSGWMVLGALATVFLVLFAGTRQPGFLIPGMILGGLALGLTFEQAGYGLSGSAVVLGLAAGFLGIYAVNALIGRAAHWWPLVPGGILAVVGGSQALAGTRGGAIAGDWWPLLLVVLGVWILVRDRAGTHTAQPSH